MRTSKRIVAAFACAFGVAIAGSAEAQDVFNAPTFGSLAWQGGVLYGSFGGRFEHRGIGPVNTFRFFPGTFTIEPTPNLGGPVAAIGYAFRDGMMPAWLGTNFRVELSGWWLAGGDTTTGSKFTPAGTAGSVTLLSGFVTASGVLGFNLTENVSATAQMDLFRLRLRATSDMPLAPSFVLSPFIGAVGGRTHLDYSLRSDELFNGVPTLLYAQNAKIRWRDIGGTAGARLTYSALPGLQLHVSGHAELVHRRATLAADDCGSTIASPATCIAFFGPSSVSASANRFAVIAGGEAGITFVGSFYQLTLAGGAEHDTRVPAIRAQTPGPAAFTTGTPASLRFIGRTTYNGGVRLTLRF